MIWERTAYVHSIFGQTSEAAAECAKRWQHAFAKQPSLPEDIIRLSGLMEVQPVEMTNGFPQPATIDPHALAYEAGKRDLGLKLLALGHITPLELNSLMEQPDVS